MSDVAKIIDEIFAAMHEATGWCGDVDPGNYRAVRPVIERALVAARQAAAPSEGKLTPEIEKWAAEEFEKLRWRSDPGPGSPNAQVRTWQPIETAPRDGAPFLAWCPIVVGMGDTDATPDAETRVIWWETRGQFTSDRDLGPEVFTHWMPLPIPPELKPSGFAPVGAAPEGNCPYCGTPWSMGAHTDDCDALASTPSSTVETK